MSRDIAIVAADYLYANAEPTEVLDRSCGIGLGRIEKDQKSSKDHVALVVARIVCLDGDLAGGDGQDPKALGPLGLEHGLQTRACRSIERNRGATAVECRADGEDVGKSALGHEEMLRGPGVLSHDDGQQDRKSTRLNSSH